MARPPSFPIEKVVQTYQRLQSTSATAKELGMAVGSVRNYLARAGIQATPTKYAPKGTDVLAGEIARLYVVENQSARQIAKALQVDHATVLKRLRQSGVDVQPSQIGKSGDESLQWKGGRSLHPSGYVMIRNPEHPSATANGLVPEHRLVMEKLIGRYLTDDEVVHHKDEDRANNHPDNLMLFANNSEHMKHHRLTDGVDLAKKMMAGRTRRRQEGLPHEPIHDA